MTATIPAHVRFPAGCVVWLGEIPNPRNPDHPLAVRSRARIVAWSPDGDSARVRPYDDPDPVEVEVFADEIEALAIRSDYGILDDPAADEHDPRL